MSSTEVTPVIPAQRREAPHTVDQVVDVVAEMRHLALMRRVRAMRLEQHTWEQVAEAIGVTKQAAQKRWGYLDREQVAIFRDPVSGIGGFRCPASGLVWSRDVGPLRSAEHDQALADRALMGVHDALTGPGSRA